MPKRIISIGSSGHYLHHELEQLCLEKDGERVGSVPIEELAAVILDHPQTTLTQSLLAKLTEANVMVVSSNAQHMPVGMFLPLVSNTLQNERFRQQANLSTPVKKQLWKQLVQSKIRMQAKTAESFAEHDGGLRRLAQKVKSGDPDNIEAQAARRYWQKLFDAGERDTRFKRDRFANDENAGLNYGYAILRALTARSLCAAGLHPCLGLHHHNKYNAYCLADDIIEPYRPIVDTHVKQMLTAEEWQDADFDLTAERRAELLHIVEWRLSVDQEQLTLQGALQKTAQSLALVVQGQSKQLCLPDA